MILNRQSYVQCDHNLSIIFVCIARQFIQALEMSQVLFPQFYIKVCIYLRDLTPGCNNFTYVFILQFGQAFNGNNGDIFVVSVFCRTWMSPSWTKWSVVSYLSIPPPLPTRPTKQQRSRKCSLLLVAPNGSACIRTCPCRRPPSRCAKPSRSLLQSSTAFLAQARCASCWTEVHIIVVQAHDDNHIHQCGGGGGNVMILLFYL